MKITIITDDGKESVIENVKAFSLTTMEGTDQKAADGREALAVQYYQWPKDASWVAFEAARRIGAKLSKEQGIIQVAGLAIIKTIDHAESVMQASNEVLGEKINSQIREN